MDAFSNARDVCVVSLPVNASFLLSATFYYFSSPCKRHLHLGKPQLEQFQLPKVLVQQVAGYCQH